MRVTVEQIGREKEEQVLINAGEGDGKYTGNRALRQAAPGKAGGAMTRTECTALPLSDVYYAETVDNRLYIYTEKMWPRLKMKLYTFEENYCSGDFFRCSRTAR